MNEILRLHLLDAMGINQYVPRAPLPGARPSPLVEIALPPQHGIADGEKTARITQALLERETGPAKPALHAVTNRKAEETTPATAAAASATTSTALSPAFRCQIAIWAVEDLLILAETPRLDNAQLALLRNILAAIGRHSELPGPQLFSWPLRERREKSLAAARDHFQGWLDSGLLQSSQLRQLVCMGDAARQLLALEQPYSNYQHWPVLCTPGLQQMLETPANKADTWQTLQILLRR